MRTYNLQLVRDYNHLTRGSFIRLPEKEAIELVSQGVAVWAVI